MQRTLLALLGAATAFVATPSMAAPPPPDGTNFGGCTTAFTNPDAVACAGYYSGNLLNGSAEDRALQADAIATLPGGAGVFDGSQAAWDALDPEWKIDADNGGTPIDFGITLFGLNIIGAHFGNAFESDHNNVTVFWLVDFGTEGGTLTLANAQGWSNAVLYTPPGNEVPEPATWAMMLLGFGATGTALRRSRRRTAHLTQIA
jgi:hypothetical protein